MNPAHVLRTSLAAGALAGLAVALFHFVATEPLVDRAIALEEARGAPPEEWQVFPRAVQKGGLLGGFLLYGLSFGLLFGGAFSLLFRYLPGRGVGSKALVLSLVALWTVALFPFLKYPANPPGVGDPVTIYARQGLYLSFLVLSLVGAAGAWAMGLRLGRRWPLALPAYGVYSLVVYLLTPPNPDPVRIPLNLLVPYRALSAAGLILFWLVFGGVYGVLWRLLGRGVAGPREPAG